MPDTPPTNIEIRQWYQEQLANIPDLNKQWIKQKISLAERAESAWRIRHEARLRAREMMSDVKALADARRRDEEIYGNPDGPDFEFLVRRLRKKGMTENVVYEEIIKSSSRSNADIDKMLGLI